MAKKTKEIEKVRKFVVCSDGMNFYVKEESFNRILENYEKDVVFRCEEDGGNEAVLYFPESKITRLASVLVPKE
jgi:hypothetical protein